MKRQKGKKEKKEQSNNMCEASRYTEEIQKFMKRYPKVDTVMEGEIDKKMERCTTDKIARRKKFQQKTNLSKSTNDLPSRKSKYIFGSFKIDETKKDGLQKLHEKFDEAGSLEHVLMLSYLYTAYSIKTRWEEVAYDYDAQTGEWKKNPMAAIDFENLREWQGNIISVAKEEMMHLNYVSVLARAVGRAPNFGISSEYPIEFPNWTPANGVPIQVGFHPLSSEKILEFVGFESNSRIGSVLAGKEQAKKDEIIDLLKKTEELHLICKAYYALGEVDERKLPEVRKFINYYRGDFCFSEKMDSTFLTHVTDIAKKKEKKEIQQQEKMLKQLNSSISLRKSINLEVNDDDTLRSSNSSANSLEGTGFYRSIKDFYSSLQEEMEQAVKNKILSHPNPTKNDCNENDSDVIISNQSETESKILKNLQLFLLPTARTGNLQEKKAETHDDDETITEGTFNSIMKIISEQGEGSNKVKRTLLEMVNGNWRLDTICGLLLDQSNKIVPGEDNGEKKLRTFRNAWSSHFGMFSRIFARLCRRESLGNDRGIPFKCEREKAKGLPKLITNHIIVNINLLYLVTRVWLHRMYLIFDKPNEKAQNAIAVATVVAWGLMSQTMRPILEILSFIELGENDLKKLFKTDDTFTAEYLPVWDANRLCSSVSSLSKVLGNRKIKAEEYEIDSIDGNAFFVLECISKWCEMCIKEIDSCDSIQWNGVNPQEFNQTSFIKGMLYRRFNGLYVCTKELISQIPFRIAGGFSGKPSREDLDKADTYSKSENLKFESWTLCNEKTTNSDLNSQHKDSTSDNQFDMQSPTNIEEAVDADVIMDTSDSNEKNSVQQNSTDDEPVVQKDVDVPKVVGVPRGVIYSAGQKVLQLKFSGWILNQLATDSDCNMSEVCKFIEFRNLFDKYLLISILFI